MSIYLNVMTMTIFLILVLFLMLQNPTTVSEQTLIACSLWFQVLLPTMFPCFVVIDVLAQTPWITKISNLLFPFFKRLFHIQHRWSSFIILICFLCGAPASTKIISDSIENHSISKTEGESLICAFSFLSLPYCLFVGRAFQLSILLMYVLFIIIAAAWMWIFNNNENDSREYLESTDHAYLYLFFNSLKKNTSILLNILGILIIFKVLLSLLIPNQLFIYPYFEILGGLSALVKTSSFTKMIAGSSLGFLGLSIHFQILSIVSEVRYTRFLLSRILFGLSGALLFLL